MCLTCLKRGQVWHRFAYTTGKPLVDRVLAEEDMNRGLRENAAPHPDYPLQPVPEFPWKQDAFHTILQWLYSRIEDTRGPPAPGG